jgi:hypothetical protein
MKTTIITFLFLFFTVSLTAQELTSKEKKIWKEALAEMEKGDQLYREQMVKHPELASDSLWKLQSTIDSTNKAQFIALTQQYGYPSKKRIGKEASIALLLHFTLEQDFLELKDLFQSELEKRNMLPSYYAWWYDRCQRNMNLPIYYGQYTNDSFCGDLLKLYNQRRAEIGLEALKPKPNCDE